MTRRSKIIIIKSIFEEIKDKRVHTFNELAEKIGTSWKTIDDCAELIDYIQKSPRIKIIKNKINFFLMETA